MSEIGKYIVVDSKQILYPTLASAQVDAHGKNAYVAEIRSAHRVVVQGSYTAVPSLTGHGGGDA